MLGGGNSRALALPEGFCTNRTEGDCFGETSPCGCRDLFRLCASVYFLKNKLSSKYFSFHIFWVCVHSEMYVCTGVCAGVFVHACMHADDSVTGVSSPCQFRESKTVF